MLKHVNIYKFNFYVHKWSIMSLSVEIRETHYGIPRVWQYAVLKKSLLIAC